MSPLIGKDSMLWCRLYLYKQCKIETKTKKASVFSLLVYIVAVTSSGVIVNTKGFKHIPEVQTCLEVITHTGG